MSSAKEQTTALTCFKAYDVRGQLGVNFDTIIAYRIGRAVAQHFQAKDIFDVLRDLPVGSGGEIQLADAINIQAQRAKVSALHSTALRFDCGPVDGFLAAISHVSNLRHSDGD